CDLTQEEMREYRGTLTEPGKESPHRNRTIEENLDLFERMKNGKIKVAGPYKVFGLVNSQYELELRPTLKDGNLVVSLENV
ncbi:glutamate--tRNA ligase family protein, partial [Clostridioides difficile]|uniref:glutamate--tRNA ligase family protein n=1 Tax=Clostridioides difficile TaxID=1496 RepID=UPI002ED495F4